MYNTFISIFMPSVGEKKKKKRTVLHEANRATFILQVFGDHKAKSTIGFYVADMNA